LGHPATERPLKYNFMIKKIKVTFLFGKKNELTKKIYLKHNFNYKKKFKITFTENHKKIKKQDIVFIINYKNILTSKFLKKNRLNLVPHSSRLPKDKGFAPLQNQVLRGQKKIYYSLIEAKKKVDSGNIYFSGNFILNGTELMNEIRKKSVFYDVKMIKKFLIKYPKFSIKKQKGISTFNKKRKINDNKIDINKSLKSQFNLLRVSHNDLYPSFFYIKNKKYILKIFKSKN